jgi:alpha-tubulin suppressor-like RCC1 family protein
MLTGIALAAGMLGLVDQASAAAATPSAPGIAIGWGLNNTGQLGNGTLTSATTPVTAKLPAGTLVTQIAEGYVNSLAVTSTGSVYAWGDDTYGELGNASTSTTPTSTPILVSSLSNIVAVAVGDYDDMALSSSGRVYTWGLGTSGELGQGSETTLSTPTLISSLPATVTSISAGFAHDLALTSTGTVYAWGYNAYGQVGNNSTTITTSPVALTFSGLGTATISAVAAGVYHSLALTSTGSIYAWGDNTVGELAQPAATTSAKVPVLIPSIVGATAISAGYFSSMAISSGGGVLTWGYSSQGELGTGTTTSSFTPVSVTGVPGTVTAIAAGQEHDAALTSTGAIYAWGDDTYGELGNASVTTPVTTPVAVHLPTGSAAIALGTSPYSFATSAILAPATTTTTVTSTQATPTLNQAITLIATVSPDDAGGTVGFFANGSTTAIPGCASIALVASGTSAQATCSTSTLPAGSDAVSATYSGDGAYQGSTGSLHGGETVSAPSGAALGFGLNTSGQLGNGTTASTATPVSVLLPAGTTVSAVAAGNVNGLLLTTTGQVYAFGDNTDGELGNGTTSTTPTSTPALVNLPAGAVVTAITTGLNSDFALTSSGQIYAWGLDNVGQLGNGATATAVSTPVLVSLPSGTVATAISAGYAHGLALTSAGQIYAWGLNSSGQLGNGSTTSTSTPILVHLPTGTAATAIGAGYAHSLAVTASGTALAWGDNTDSELGNGTTTSSASPVAVSLPSGTTVSAVSGGYFSSEALTSSGGVLMWGANSDGELGNGTTATSATPTAVSLPSGTVTTAIADEFVNGLALTSTGQLYAWGNNSYGQLGNGTETSSSTPVLVALPNGSMATQIGASSLAASNLVVVSAVTTATTVTSSLPSAVANQAVTFTATVSPANAAGTVAFTSNGVAIPGCSTAQVVRAGTTYVATCSTSTLPVGTDAITATFGGDGIHQASTGALSGGQVVTAAPSGVAVGFGLNNLGQLGTGTTATATAPVASLLPSGATVSAVAGGFGNSLFLTSTGAVYASGDDTYGELGNGTTSTTPATTPSLVSLPSGTVVTAISVGYYNDLALTSTGQLYSWGINNVGQLGNGTTTTASTPGLVALPTGTVVTAISAGFGHELALTAGGTIYAWGLNSSGQLGNGTTTSYTTANSTPSLVALPAGTSATAIAAGFAQSLAVTSTGTVLAWGDNSTGELGTGTTTSSTSPVAVVLPSGTTATAVAAGYFTSEALTPTGSVLAWGANNDGQLGNGSTAASNVPVAVSLPSGTVATSIVDEYADGLALASTGQTYGWGNNADGQLGIGTASAPPVTTPVAVALPAASTASGIGASAYSLSNLAIVSAVGTTTTVTTSGSPSVANQPVTFTATVSPGGISGTVAFSADGVAIPGCSAAAITVEGSTSAATCSTSTLPVGLDAISATFAGDGVHGTSTGTLSGGQTVTAAPSGLAVGFGLNNLGQLGTGTLTTPLTPVASALPEGTSLSQVAAGYANSLYLTTTGIVFASGDDTFGELGNGTTSTTASSTPSLVTFPAGTVITAVAVGYYDDLALTSTGQVYAWGVGTYGEMGNGTITSNDLPTLVSLPVGTVATAISAGYGHDLALTSSGALYAWGLNASGQLGNGSTTSSATPVLVALPTGTSVSAMAAGYAASLALTSTGSVLSWGDNAYGELGNGTTTSSDTPVSVTLPSGTTVTALSAGYFTSEALTSTGGVLAWGLNSSGELGNGTTANAAVPSAVSLPAGTVAIAVAQELGDGFALTSNGQLYAWGANSGAELGNGTVTASSTPTLVSLPTGSLASGIGTSPYSASTLALVSAVPTTVTITSTANPSISGQAVTFTATVTPANAAGTVTFTSNGSDIAGCSAAGVTLSGTTYSATCSTSTLAVGSDTIAATYSGDGVHQGSTGTLASPQVVAAAPSGLAIGFGLNNLGQLGNGTKTSEDTPVLSALPSGTTVSAAVGGYANSLFLTTTGSVYATGDDTYGELGNGTTSTTVTTSPTLVTFPAGTVMTAVAVGYYNDLALTSTGQVYAWGLNNEGQLGNSSTTDADVPTLVSLPSGTVATAIAAGYGHELALTSTGQIYAWGLGTSGQLGNAAITSTSTPVAVHLPAGTSASAIAAGYAQSLAVTSTGLVLAWGDNSAGELGNGTTTSSATPVVASLPAGTTATGVSAGYFTSQALTSTGSVLAWGANNDGQLGNGSTTATSVPVSVALPSGTVATAIVDEYADGLALSSTGQLFAWGNNADGQLGNGAPSTTNASTPVAVSLPSGSTVEAVGASGFSLSNLAVLPAVTTAVTVTSSLNPSVYAKSVTFTASVAPTNGTGTVTFNANGSTTAITGCGSVPLTLVGGAYQATCTTSTLPAGTNAITATYSGDGIHQPSTGTLSGGQVVTAAPTTTTIVTSVNPGTYASPVTFTATVSPTDGGGSVAFYADGATTAISGCGTVALSTVSGNEQATCTTSTLAGGAHTITAVYSGDGNYQGSTGSLSGGETIKIATALTTSSISVLKSLTSLATTYSATLTMRPSGTPLAGQTITFAVGGTSQCTGVTNAQGVATCSTTLVGTISAILALGSTATYAGNSLYLPSQASAKLSL